MMLYFYSFHTSNFTLWLSHLFIFIDLEFLILRFVTRVCLWVSLGLKFQCFFFFFSLKKFLLDSDFGNLILVSQIIKLAAVRINGMVERLQLSQQIRENVYCLFQQILSQRTFLFFNRHIDQIILCSFYGVAKVEYMNLWQILGICCQHFWFTYTSNILASRFLSWASPLRK